MSFEGMSDTEIICRWLKEIAETLEDILTQIRLERGFDE